MRLVALAAITRLDCLGGAGSCAFRVLLMLPLLVDRIPANVPKRCCRNNCARLEVFKKLLGVDFRDEHFNLLFVFPAALHIGSSSAHPFAMQ